MARSSFVARAEGAGAREPGEEKMFENIFRNCGRYSARSDSGGVMVAPLPGTC